MVECAFYCMSVYWCVAVPIAEVSVEVFQLWKFVEVTVLYFRVVSGNI